MSIDERTQKVKNTCLVESGLKIKRQLLSNALTWDKFQMKQFKYIEGSPSDSGKIVAINQLRDILRCNRRLEHDDNIIDDSGIG